MNPERLTMLTAKTVNFEGVKAGTSTIYRAWTEYKNAGEGK